MLSRLPPGLERGLARWAAPALFVLVALVHLHQNRTAHLNPWLGGGFGMFSTIAVPWPQGLSIEAEDAAGRRCFVDWSPAPGLPGPLNALGKAKIYSQPRRSDLDAAADLALRARFLRVQNGPREALLALKDAGVLDRVRLRESPVSLAEVALLRTQASRPDPTARGLVHARAAVWGLHFDGDAGRFFLERVGAAGEGRRLP